MIFEQTDKKCPACNGKIFGIKLENKMRYVCDECGTTVFVPINEENGDTKQLLKG